MKRFLKGIIVILPLLLTSCKKNKDAIDVFYNGDIVPNNYQMSFYEVNVNNIINLMDNNFSFVLYQYSTACSHCETSTFNFEKFFKNYPYTIYRYNAYLDDNYRLLTAYDEVAFPSTIITPRVLVFKNGKYVNQVNSTKLVESRLFNNSVNAFIKNRDGIYQITTLDSYLYFYQKNNNIKTYLYDSSSNQNESYFDIYNDKNYKEMTLLIDKVFAKEELLSYLNK